MRKENQDTRKSEIEKIALQMLINRGYSSASMLLIAKDANASNETLYRWYKNKPNLFLAVIERHFEGFSTLETESQLNDFLALPSTVALFRAAIVDFDLGVKLAGIMSKQRDCDLIQKTLGRFMLAHLLGDGKWTTLEQVAA